jgi:hypothetical protein
MFTNLIGIGVDKPEFSSRRTFRNHRGGIWIWMDGLEKSVFIFLRKGKRERTCAEYGANNEVGSSFLVRDGLAIYDCIFILKGM